jgi:hypothetical protein
MFPWLLLAALLTGLLGAIVTWQARTGSAALDAEHCDSRLHSRHGYFIWADLTSVPSPQDLARFAQWIDARALKLSSGDFFEVGVLGSASAGGPAKPLVIFRGCKPRAGRDANILFESSQHLDRAFRVDWEDRLQAARHLLQSKPWPASSDSPLVALLTGVASSVLPPLAEKRLVFFTDGIEVAPKGGFSLLDLKSSMSFGAAKRRNYFGDASEGVLSGWQVVLCLWRDPLHARLHESAAFNDFWRDLIHAYGGKVEIQRL